MINSRTKPVLALLGGLALVGVSCGRDNPSAPASAVDSNVRIDLGLAQALECTVYETASLSVNGQPERTEQLESTGSVTFENVTVEVGSVTFEVSILSNSGSFLLRGTEVTTVNQDGFDILVDLDPVAGILVLDTCSVLLSTRNGFRASVQARNIGSAPLRWTVIALGTPLEFTPNTGNLGPGETATIEVSFPIDGGLPTQGMTFAVGLDQQDLAGSLMGNLDLQVQVPTQAIEQIGFDGIPPGTRDPVVTVATGTVATSATGCSNTATIYDTSAGHTADPDLNAQPAQAEVLIIEEDFDDLFGDGVPDDCEVGGTLTIDFSDVAPGTVTLVSLRLLDIDAVGNTIDLFGPNDTPITLGIPAPVTGDGTITLPINLGPTFGVTKVVVNLVRSGAVDDILFVPDP
jgi:hypothetical protein